jgi:hypothetical protein
MELSKVGDLEFFSMSKVSAKDSIGSLSIISRSHNVEVIFVPER